MHLHAYELPVSSYTPTSVVSNVLYRLAPVLEIGTLTKTILHAQRKQRFVLDARGGRVACPTEMRYRATLSALVEDSLKKSTEGHHEAFD